MKPSRPAHRWRRACVALALALVGAVSTGCASAPDTRDVAAEPVALAGPARTVTIGVLRQPHLSHALFYQPFLPTNVTLEVVPFANSTEIKNAVVSGDLDLGVTGITSAMQGAAKGEPVVVVGVDPATRRHTAGEDQLLQLGTHPIPYRSHLSILYPVSPNDDVSRAPDSPTSSSPGRYAVVTARGDGSDPIGTTHSFR